MTGRDVDKARWILSAAARQIERHGWHQGGFTAQAQRSWQVPCDVLAAIALAANGKPWHLRGLDHVLQVLAAQIGTAPAVPAIAQWNDTPGRTAGEVVAVLQTAADKAQEVSR